MLWTRCDIETTTMSLRHWLQLTLTDGIGPVLSRRLIDATRPWTWREKFSEVAEWSPQWKALMKEKWESVILGEAREPREKVARAERSTRPGFHW